MCLVGDRGELRTEKSRQLDRDAPGLVALEAVFGLIAHREPALGLIFIRRRRALGQDLLGAAAFTFKTALLADGETGETTLLTRGTIPVTGRLTAAGVRPAVAVLPLGGTFGLLTFLTSGGALLASVEPRLRAGLGLILAGTALLFASLLTLLADGVAAGGGEIPFLLALLDS